MKKILSVWVMAAATAAAMAGCASPSVDAAASSLTRTATASATPTPTPTPTAMSTAAAGKYYLDNVCPSNKATIALENDVIGKTVQSLDVQTVRAAAAAQRDGYTNLARALSSPPQAWPSAVKPDVDSFVQGLYKEISDADQLAAQTTARSLLEVWNAKQDSGAGTSASAIRVKLGLATDAMSSCGLSQ